MKIESKEQLIEKFETFDLEIEIKLDLLIRYVEDLKNPKYLPLDYSFESLDRIESVFRDILNNVITCDLDTNSFGTSVARYLGEVLRKNLGGKWKLELRENPKLINYGYPGISEIPGLAIQYNWCPFIVVNNFRIDKKKGLFKDSVISHLDWIKK